MGGGRRGRLRMEWVPVSRTSKPRLPPLGISPASDGRDNPEFLVGLEVGGGEAPFTFRGVLRRTGCQVQAPANPAADAGQSRLTGDFTDSPVKASVLKQVTFTVFLLILGHVSRLQERCQGWSVEMRPLPAGSGVRSGVRPGCRCVGLPLGPGCPCSCRNDTVHPASF